MKSLSPDLKIKVLKGLSGKLRSPSMKMDSFKEPKLGEGISARVKKEINPDYAPRRKTTLTGKIF